MTHFYRDFDLIGWRIGKLFYHTMDGKIKFEKEQSYKNAFMKGTYHTWGKNGYYCFNQLPVIQIGWANWDGGLIFGRKGKVSRINPYDYGTKQHTPGVSLEDIGYLVNSSRYIKNSKLAMFRISKYSSTNGKSFLSGKYVPVYEYHCHHIKPVSKGGTNDFENLCVLSETEHRILHSKTPEKLFELYPMRWKKIRLLIENL